MKRLILGITLFAAAAAFGQTGGPQATGINAAMLKMFGNIKAFSSKGEVRMTDKSGKEVSSMPMFMAMRDGKLRTEMDMTQMKNASMSQESLSMLKSTGMDKMHMIVSPDKKSTLLIYPGLQAYAAIPISEKEAMANAKVETTELGKETVDGHPCIKRKLTATDEKGEKQEATVWSATDLKEFPIKLEMKQDQNTVHFTYKSPSLETPDAALFDVPANYTKYDNVQALMQGAMMKMFGNMK